MSASSIPLSSTLRVLSQNVNGFQTKVALRKRKQNRIVALRSLLRSLEVDFFAIQELHCVTAEDHQVGARCLSKYGYGLDGPLHEKGRGGVALVWKTSKWTLQAMQFLSPRAPKASPSSGPLEITLMVVHFHHKHSRRQAQWKEIAKELHGPNLILCADHTSLMVKHRDALAPLEFEHDTSLRAREQEVAALAKAGLHDVWIDIRYPTLMDIRTRSRPVLHASCTAILGTKSDLIHSDCAASTAFMPPPPPLPIPPPPCQWPPHLERGIMAPPINGGTLARRGRAGHLL